MTNAERHQMMLPFPEPGPSATLRTERDVVESLRGRTVTVEELYRACESAGVTPRADGNTVVHGRTDTRSRRRARGALQSLRRAGRARRVADGTWLIEGTLERPRSLVLVLAGEVSRMELVLSAAETLLQETDEPPALILADPPWALGINATGCAARDNAERTYARNPAHLVGGYHDVGPEHYREFTHRWISAATQILTPGSYLVVITGPAQAARVQTIAEDTGRVSFVNQVIVPRPFALPTSRRFSHAHTVVTILCSGSVQSRRRFFAVPEDLPKAASGRDYPLDVWADLGAHTRRGLVRYPTMVHPAIPDRLIRALTPGPDNGGRSWQSLVVDPFLGGGETAIAAMKCRRRFRGGDINPRALRLAAARLSFETPSCIP